jgi:hypothetical protein
MVAKKKNRKRGQSMLEFALLVPIIVLMLQILIETESAVSTAIVNQKYSRNTMQFLMFNHRNYLERHFVAKKSDASYLTRYWIGVSNDVMTNESAGAAVKPKAPLRPIGLVKKLPSDADSEQPQTEYDDIEERKYLRIRTSIFTCVPPLSVNNNGLLAEGNMREDTFTGKYRYCDIDH